MELRCGPQSPGSSCGRGLSHSCFLTHLRWLIVRAAESDRVFHAPGTAQPSALQLRPALQFLDCNSWPCGLAPLVTGLLHSHPPPPSSSQLPVPKERCSHRVPPGGELGSRGSWPHPCFSRFLRLLDPNPRCPDSLSSLWVAEKARN